MGYYFLTADTGEQEPDPAIRGKLFGVWILPDQSAEEANATLAPFEQVIRKEASSWPDPVHFDNSLNEFPDFSTFWQFNPPSTVGSPGRLGSRLLGRDALSVEPERLKQALKNSTLIPQFSILGHVVAGKGVKNANIVGGNNSVLPAWRDAITHLGMCFSHNYMLLPCQQSVLLLTSSSSSKVMAVFESNSETKSHDCAPRSRSGSSSPDLSKVWSLCE